MDNQPMREMTYGEKAVGLTFNPGNNPDVDAVKKLYAEIIDSLNDKVVAEQNAADHVPNGEKIRLFKVAITEAQTAQMWAVKAITWQF